MYSKCLLIRNIAATLAIWCLLVPYAEAVDSVSCCQSLAASLGSKVLYPDSTAYSSSLASYWSAQEQTTYPACILRASSAQDVSTALKVLVPRACKFAVRGGGHGALAGLANIQDGVTIDLRGLDPIKPFAANQLVSVGSGLRIGAIYHALHPLGVAISGGRSYDVGVPGSTLGNGWGWLSNEAGFCCDNVVEYEVVLANGTIITASQQNNANLWKSLKGGREQLWHHVVYSLTESQVPRLLSAVSDFAARRKPDPKETLLFTFSYTPMVGNMYYIQCVYTAPTVQPPAGFDQLLTLPGALFRATNASNTLPGLSYDYNLNTPKGSQTYNASIASVSGVYGIQWTLSFQPLTRLMTDASAARGGNVLGIGLPPEEGLHEVQLTAAFPDAVDYSRVSQAADQLLADCTAAVKSPGADWPWVEMNHASHIQDPISTYGEENRAFMMDTAAKYDPDAVFQTLMPGGYKLKGGHTGR
ncbi:uncharacterized protein PG986_000744 [Apiospora aurea]|uniref:FAD-binding PCMH-type domain-containing protein n=1 Tax=Apiospora aurea TaxID=335848 RepID=A0ABR1QVE5_9PEZI